MNITAKYFWYCKACNCYEYDCRGTDGCITLELGYLSAHQRARVRKGLCPFCNADEMTDHPDGASGQCGKCGKRS